MNILEGFLTSSTLDLLVIHGYKLVLMFSLFGNTNISFMDTIATFIFTYFFLAHENLNSIKLYSQGHLIRECSVGDMKVSSGHSICESEMIRVLCYLFTFFTKHPLCSFH